MQRTLLALLRFRGGYLRLQFSLRFAQELEARVGSLMLGGTAHCLYLMRTRSCRLRDLVSQALQCCLQRFFLPGERCQCALLGFLLLLTKGKHGG